MCSQRTHSTLRDKLPDKEAQTRFQSLVTINGNDGYNFELTKDLKTTIKQATDDVETYKLRDLHARGAAKGGANAAAPAAANATTTAAATAAGGNARSAACGGSAPTSGGGSSASHATLGTTERSHSQALPTQPTSGATSSTGPTVRAPSNSGKKRARDSKSSSSSGTQQSAAAPLTAEELERATEAMLNQMFSSDCEEVPFEALFARLEAEDARVAAAGREAVESALAAMQAADEIVHSGANIHLI